MVTCKSRPSTSRAATPRPSGSSTGTRPSPYGSVTASGIDQPIQWSSEHYDPELALVYYNYRHYNPLDGRWINRDPIAEKGGRNLYGFVGNSIYNFLDVLGTDRIYKCEGSNCLGSALSGRGDVAYRTDDKKPKSSFMNEMKLKGWKCYKIEKTYKDCLCKCEEAKVVISAYKIEDVNKGKDPWTDPSFHWEPQREINPGDEWPTDYHAMRSDYGDQDNYFHISGYSVKKRKFKKVPQKIFDAIFTNKPMLCCCKKRSNTISPNDIEKKNNEE
ncbi:RHS repeat-associated core domain-containing protein [Akkermansia glycaniphila]|nr:RHS repeat-associated core domain-containing protein [Akkermansia glycaniphila]